MVASAGLLVVVHERVQVREVPVQINFSGVPSTHQVAVELWTLLTHTETLRPVKSPCFFSPPEQFWHLFKLLIQIALRQQRRAGLCITQTAQAICSVTSVNHFPFCFGFSG